MSGFCSGPREVAASGCQPGGQAGRYRTTGRQAQARTGRHRQAQAGTGRPTGRPACRPAGRPAAALVVAAAIVVDWMPLTTAWRLS